MTSTWHTDQAVPNYRHRLAVLFPAAVMCYLTLIWQLLYARPGMTEDATSGPIAADPFYVFNRLVFPALAALSILLLLTERRNLSRFSLGGMLLVGALFTALGMTACWSIAPMTSASKFLLYAMQTIAFVPAVLLAKNIDEIMKPLFFALVATLFVNLLAVAVMPPTPIGHSGIFTHKNDLGDLAALTGIFVAYGLRDTYRPLRLLSLVVFAVALLLLILSESKTSLALCLLAPILALGVLFARRYLKIAFPVLLMLVFVPAFFLLNGTLADFDFRDISRSVSGDATFTGRTTLWSFALEQVAERPLLGFGYQAFWGTGSASPAFGVREGFVATAAHGHNGYIDLLLQGGLLVFVLFIASLFVTARWIDLLNATRPGLGYAFSSLFIYLILRNLLESGWLQPLSFSGSLATLMLFMAITWRKKRPLA